MSKGHPSRYKKSQVDITDFVWLPRQPLNHQCFFAIRQFSDASKTTKLCEMIALPFIILKKIIFIGVRKLRFRDGLVEN